MRTSLRLLVASLAVLGSYQYAAAQCGCTTQAFRIAFQTVCEPQTINAFKIENETVFTERQVTSFRPVWETESRERRYTVAKPVMETSTREERYTVQKPVWETAERVERYTVRKPVYETAERDESYTVMEPVTTYTTNYVDQGQFVCQQYCVPGPVRNRLAWQPATCAVDPATGQSTFQRAGLAWVQEQGPPTMQVARVWQPNVVAQQVPQTTFVAKVVTRKVPIQVCRFQDEVVEQRIPYQVCKFVPQEEVRQIPVTTCRIQYEERVEPLQVQVCKWVAEPQTIREAQVVQKQVPVSYTVNVQRVVAMKIPIDPCTGADLPVATAPTTSFRAPGTTVVPSTSTPSSTPSTTGPATTFAPNNGNSVKVEPTPANKSPSDKENVPGDTTTPNGTTPPSQYMPPSTTPGTDPANQKPSLPPNA